MPEEFKRTCALATGAVVGSRLSFRMIMITIMIMMKMREHTLATGAVVGSRLSFRMSRPTCSTRITSRGQRDELPPAEMPTIHSHGHDDFTYDFIMIHDERESGGR